jgi:hypothetical protein
MAGRMRALLPLALGLCLQAAEAVPAQDEAARVAALKTAFKRPNTQQALASKRAALGNLQGLDSPQVAQALIAAFGFLEQEAEPLRAARRGLLFRGGGSQRLWPLRLRLQPVRDLQEEVLAALRRLRSQEASEAMLAALLRDSQPFGLRLVLAERAGDLPQEGLNLVQRAVDASARKKAGEIILLLQLAGSLGRRAQKTAAWATAQLEHPSEAVRRQAARALATLCWPGSLAPLIDRLDQEHGVTREQILDTLVVLTAQGPGNTATAWRAWLKQSGGPYLRGEVRLGQGKAEFRKREADDENNKNNKNKGTTAGTYFGIPQDGKDILYVFDASMSMRRAGDGSDRGRRGAGGRGFEPNPDVESRWDLCKKELHAALDKLTPAKTFNLVGFADKLQVFSQKMLRATPKNIARAHQWIDRVRLEFQTNIHDALELSFYIAGRGAKDRYYPVVVDTIFFLSDGAPTRPINPNGQVPPAGQGPRIQRDDVRQILAAVRRWNPLGRIVVHTIGLGLGLNDGRMGRRRRGGGQGGGQGARSFLKRLAEQNDGRFVEPK